MIRVRRRRHMVLHASRIRGRAPWMRAFRSRIKTRDASVAQLPYARS